jgi:hypothetical protein
MVAPLERECLSPLRGSDPVVPGKDASYGLLGGLKMLRFVTAPVLTLVEVGQRQIRGNVVRVVTDDSLSGPTRSIVVAHLPLGLPDQPEGRPLETETSDLGREQAQPTRGLRRRGQPNLLNEVRGNHLSDGSRRSLAQAG